MTDDKESPAQSTAALRPNYYQASVRSNCSGGGFASIECFDLIEALGFEQDFSLGTVLKYLWRSGRKTPDALEDLKKARVYLDRAIAIRERRR